MKKLKLILSIVLFFAASSMTFAQYCEITVGDVDVTGLNAGDPVVVPVTMVAHDDLVMGWEFYILFDDTYLSWAPGFLQNQTPLFPGGWFEGINDAGGGMWEFAANWLDPFFSGVDVPDGTLLFELHLTYDGGLSGASPLTWNYSKKEVSNFQVKGVTAVVNSSFGFFDNLVTNNGSIFEGGAVVTDWIGDTSDDWNDPLNWTFGVPTGDPTETVNIDATITKATFAPTIYGSVATGALNLIAGTLSIAPGGDLTTNGPFTNGGTLYMSSDALGMSASYIDNAGVTAGNYQFDRDVFASGAVPNSNDPFGWHYVSSPVAGFDSDDLPDYFVNAWDETADSWIQYAMDPVINPCTPWPTTPMNAMDAWSVNFDNTYPGPCTTLPPGTGAVVEMMGTSLNALAQSVPATVSGGTYSGWNMYGNPYASSIDPSLINWTGFDGVQGVAMYDGAAGNYLYSGSGNAYPYFVGPTQGFFVLAMTPGNFGLTGVERAHAAGQVIYKDDVSGLLTLEATGDETSDLTYIRFMEGVEAGMDVADFPKLFSTTEGLAQIYTTAQGEDLAINALPETPVVPMGFTSVTSGEYTISAIETSDFANVVLEDRVTGEQTDLLTASYTFNYTVNDDADRFFVHFTPL